MVDPHFFVKKTFPSAAFVFLPKIFNCPSMKKRVGYQHFGPPKDGWMRTKIVGWKKVDSLQVSTKRTSHFLGALKRVCWNRQKLLPALTRPKEWTSCLSTTSFCVRDAGRGLKLDDFCEVMRVGWNRSYLQLVFFLIMYTYIYINIYNTCIIHVHTCIINVYHVFICTSLHMSYIYICWNSHGDMTSCMVLKSPARPVLDGLVPPWRLGSNSGYVTDRWMWKNHGIPTQNGKMEPNGV